MNHPLLRTAEIRAIEARGLASTPPGTLMRRAAAALGQVCAQHLRRLPAGTTVLALVGPGNNGGDALLAALWLQARGYRVQAMALSPVLPTASWRAPYMLRSAASASPPAGGGTASPPPSASPAAPARRPWR